MLLSLFEMCALLVLISPGLDKSETYVARARCAKYLGHCVVKNQTKISTNGKYRFCELTV